MKKIFEGVSPNKNKCSMFRANVATPKQKKTIIQRKEKIVSMRLAPRKALR